MNTFKALLQREYWEHRGAFLKTPLIMGSLMSIFLILFYLTVEQFDLRVGGGQYIELGSATMDELDTSGIQSAIDIFMLFTGSIFHFVLFIILFFFLLGSLYDDRKDGSILFWKSLPVSDTQTVLSKFTTAIVVVPIIFTLGLMVSHLFFFIIGSLIFLLNGINPFTILWSNILR